MTKIFGLIAKLENCKNSDFLSDKNKALSLVRDAAKESKATIFSEHAYEFNPYGISAVVIVGESHFAIHTWPENNMAYFVATICKKADLEKGLKFVIKKLKAKKVVKEYIEI